jgi:hypothetical protein
MPKRKHTRGYWEARDRQVTLLRSLDEGEGVIAGDIRGADDDEANANARLIAAAPELFEALVAIVQGAGDGSGIRPYSTDSYLPAQFIDAARAAIAKAEGPQ